MLSSDVPISWKRNLTIAWIGCFLTGAAFSLVMPFLPLYVEQLGITGHSELNLWSGLVFSITFLFSAIASPFWGGLADRKGRKIMLLRSALGISIVMVLMGLAQNIWQFLLLRALLGLLGGFVPNANALIATQIPRHKSGWALGTLSRARLGPLPGGLLVYNSTNQISGRIFSYNQAFCDIGNVTGLLIGACDVRGRRCLLPRKMTKSVRRPVNPSG